MIDQFYNYALGIFADGFKALLGDLMKIVIGAALFAGYLNIQKYFKPQLKLLGFGPKDKYALYFGNTKTGQHGTQAFDAPTESYVYGDIEATLRVVEAIRSLVDAKIAYHRILSDPHGLSDVVLSVGGPKWNKATEHLIGLLGSPACFENNKKALMVYRKSSGCYEELPFSIRRQGNISIVRDYGVILVGKEEYFKSIGRSKIKAVSVVMGYSTVGVRVAADYLVKIADRSNVEVKQLLKNQLPSGSDRFCIIITSDIQLTDIGEYSSHEIISVEIISSINFKSSCNYVYN